MYFLVVAAGGRTTWERLRVPVEQPSFLDMRSLTSAWECDRRGIDVLPVNPCDPRGRPANYPSLWLVPAPVGLGDDDTVWLGIGLAVVFFVSALAVAGPLTVREGVIYGIALCSPAVMFGVERGNPDLAIFALLAGALLALGGGAARRAIAYGLLFAAAVLKLFPVFAWGVLIRQARYSAIGAMIAAFCLYLAIRLAEIRTLLDVVPREILFSYGAGVLADGLVASLDLPGARTSAMLAAALVLAGAVVALTLGLRWRAAGARLQTDGRLDAFWVGAGIYVGSYAVMHNFDYRMIFLLFALPGLVRWSGTTNVSMPLAAWGLAAALTSLLLAARPRDDLAAEEFVNWLLFVYLGAVLVATVELPPRLTGRCRKAFRARGT